jgi:hypothetical protein
MLATTLGAFVVTSPRADAAPAWTSISQMSQTETIAGVDTTVTATLGENAFYRPVAYAPDFYWETDATEGAPGAWVRWSFDHDVTSLRIGVGAMESYDPYMITTDLGPVDFQTAIVDSGQVNGGWAGGIPLAGGTPGLLVCPADGPQCGGWVELSFPAGIEWIEVSGVDVGVGANLIDLQVNAGTSAQPVAFDGATIDMTQSPYSPTAATVPTGGGAITYSVADAGTTGCTVDATTGVITYTAVGTCRVTASAAGNEIFDAGSTTADFVITRVTQTVTFAGNSELTVPDSPYAAEPATTSGDGSITYAVTDAGTTGCTVDAATGVITYTGIGTCRITATAAQTAVYAEASEAADFVVSLIPQIVTFAGGSLTTLQTPYTPTPATSDGPGMISYAVTSPGTSGCTVDASSGELTYITSGTCVVTATAAATGGYASGDTPASFVVSKVAQTVSFDGSSLTMAQTPYSLTSPATTTVGGGEITYAVADAGTTGCTVDASTGELTYTAPGECDVEATAASNDVYLSASQVATFTIGLAAQTVSFDGASLTTLQSPYSPVAATTTGDGSITYAVADAGTTGCIVDAGTGELTYTGAGTCQVTATAAATETYATASQSAAFVIATVPQTVSFTGAALTTMQSPYGLAAPATTSGDGAISYAVTDAGTTGCTVDATTGELTFSGAGTCRVTATAAANATYSQASTTATFSISRVPGTVTWPEPGTQRAPGGVWTPPAGATAVGGGAITYSLVSGPCTVDPITGVTTFQQTGTCVVRATSAETAQYDSAWSDIVVEGIAVERAPATTPSPTSATDAPPSALAMTGTMATSLAGLGLLVLALGVVLMSLAPRRRRAG